MDPLEFDGQTRLLGAPPGWNESEPVKCGYLPIRDVRIEAMRAMVSYWKPTPEELAAINAGVHVRLVVFGEGHPPVWVDVEKCDALIERRPG